MGCSVRASALDDGTLFKIVSFRGLMSITGGSLDSSCNTFGMTPSCNTFGMTPSDSADSFFKLSFSSSRLAKSFSKRSGGSLSLVELGFDPDNLFSSWIWVGPSSS